jgi:hypothetical protein
MKPINAFVLLLALFLNSAHGLVTENNATAETNPFGATGFDWTHVVSFNGSSAVAIAPNWLLTARHVADDLGNTSVTVNSVVYNQIGEVYHPTADLALVELDKNLPGYYDVYTGTYPTQQGQRKNVLAVGYGNTGTVASTTTYTWGNTGRGTKRWGTNKVDFETSVGGTWPTEAIYMGFNTADSDNEAGGNIGDSGGGVFINDAGTWKVAGIMITVTGSNPYTGLVAANVQDYHSWITDTVGVIPELSSGLLAGLLMAAVALLLRKRKS